MSAVYSLPTYLVQKFRGHAISLRFVNWMRKCTTHKSFAAAKGIQLELVVFDGFHHACAFYYSGNRKLVTIYDRKKKYKNTFKIGIWKRESRKEGKEKEVKGKKGVKRKEKKKRRNGRGGKFYNSM